MVARLVHSLARFMIAEHFRSRTKIPSDLARFVGHVTTAVGPGDVRALLARGWLALPAAGQYVTTEIGRKRVGDAINARSKETGNANK